MAEELPWLAGSIFTWVSSTVIQSFGSIITIVLVSWEWERTVEWEVLGEIEVKQVERD